MSERRCYIEYIGVSFFSLPVVENKVWTIFLISVKAKRSSLGPLKWFFRTVTDKHGEVVFDTSIPGAEDIYFCNSEDSEAKMWPSIFVDHWSSGGCWIFTLPLARRWNLVLRESGKTLVWRGEFISSNKLYFCSKQIWSWDFWDVSE